LLAALAALTAATGAPTRARAQLAVLTSLVEERTASPGDRYTGRITVKNTTDQPQNARIYQTDFRFAADGSSHTDDPGSSPRSNAPWVHPQSTRISIPPRGEVSVPYSVEVPQSDSLRGTYWSMIMIEGAQTPAEMNAKRGAASVGVASVMRYAVQVATHIGSTGSRNAQFTDVEASKTDKGVSSLDLTVVDTGERGFRPVLWVEVYDANGALRAKGKQSRGLLYPGTSLRQHFDLGALTRGTYKAVVFADTGVEPVFAAQFTVVF
jgi:hypothetical protein